MQENIHTSLSWTQLVLGFFATLLTGGGLHKIYNSWLGRKKPAAEVHVTEAQAIKTRAEARKINADADVQVNTIIERLHARIDQMQAGVDEIRSERDGYRAERDEFKLRYELQTIELTMRDKQVKRMKGILDAKSINLTDFDEPSSHR